ncbi:MAG: hypothetical protein J7605_27235 [Variovorax sp.]|nr:hypothetical protein [Variovorax sp.]
MNIYENNGGGDPGGPLAPAEWTMSVRLEGVGDGAYYIADLRRAGQDVCRVSKSNGFLRRSKLGEHIGHQRPAFGVGV